MNKSAPPSSSSITAFLSWFDLNVFSHAFFSQGAIRPGQLKPSGADNKKGLKAEI